MRAAVDELHLSPLHEATLWDYLQRAAHAMVNTFEPSGIGPSSGGRAAASLPLTASPPDDATPSIAATPDDEGVAMPPATTHSADVLVIGWGLAGLVAASEAAAAGKKVVIVDQEPRTNLGGQAWWSFGGLFFVDSPEQRRMGIKDSLDLARQDWFGNAGFDREEDAWPRRWAEAYLQFAAGEKRSWLREKGVGLLPRRRMGRAGRVQRYSDPGTRSPASTSRGARARASSLRSRRPSRRPRSAGLDHDPPPSPRDARSR